MSDWLRKGQLAGLELGKPVPPTITLEAYPSLSLAAGQLFRIEELQLLVSGAVLEFVELVLVPGKLPLAVRFTDWQVSTADPALLASELEEHGILFTTVSPQELRTEGNVRVVCDEDAVFFFQEGTWRD